MLGKRKDSDSRVNHMYFWFFLTTCLPARSLGVGRRLTIYDGLRFMVSVWEFHQAPHASRFTVMEGAPEQLKGEGG